MSTIKTNVIVNSNNQKHYFWGQQWETNYFKPIIVNNWVQIINQLKAIVGQTKKIVDTTIKIIVLTDLFS